MNGTACGTNQNCVNNSVTYSSDVNQCCVTSCVDIKTSSNKTVSIVLIVIVIVILVVVLLFLRKKPKKGIKEFADELSNQQPGEFKSKEFKEEFGAGLGQEVK